MKTILSTILIVIWASACFAGYQTLQDSNRYVTVSTETVGVESVWFCYPDKLECDVTTTNVAAGFSAAIRIEPRPDWELLTEDGIGTVSERTVIMHPGDQVKYRVRHKDTGELSPWGLVVMFRADAILDDIGEDAEATDGAFLPEIPPTLSPNDEAFRSACRTLRFDLLPVNPPTPDQATLTWAGIRFFEIGEDGAWSEIQSGVKYLWNELASKNFRVAGITPSTKERDYWIKVEHRTNKCTDTAWLTVARIDVDIDTFNLHGTSAPSRTTEADLNEEVLAKMVQMNDLDSDGDYIPDYLDGFGLFGGNRNDAIIENGNNFYPIVLECLPSLTDCSIRFDYNCPNDPTQTGISTFADAANAHTNAATGNPLGSGIRIWTKPESVSRNPAQIENGGDFIKPGELIEFGTLFPAGKSTTTLYAEGIGTSPSLTLPLITVSLVNSHDKDIVSDKVAYCVVRCVYYLCVYRPYVYDSANDVRTEHLVNYTTPRTMFSGYCEGASLPDKKFHKKSAFMGHAFARIQSRTPTSNFDVWTGQTGMAKAGKDWSIADCLEQLRNGMIFWHSFPDGRQNTRSDLEEPWGFFIGNDRDGYLTTSSNLVKPLTTVLEYRIPSQTADALLSYRNTHPFSNYGLDATIKEGASRCGCGSYIAILTERSGLTGINNWLVDKRMPIIPLPNSIPETSLGVLWKGEEEILEDAKTEFFANPNSAQWNIGQAMPMKFADPGIMAKWIDAKNSANPVVNKENRTGQSIQLFQQAPSLGSIGEWNR